MRVLVVKLGAIGDVIMSLTMIPALRDADPAAHLTWMVGRAVSPLLEMIDGIDTILPVNDAGLLRGGIWTRGDALLGAWRRVALRRFDLIVTAHSDGRYRVLTAPAFAGTRRSFRSRGRAGPLPWRYHGDEYARLITGRDGPDTARYELPRITRSLPQASFERTPADRVIVLAPGGARNLLRDDALRRWPVEYYAQVARRLLDQGCRVVLVGAPHDAPYRASFGDMPVIDLIGKTSLAQLAASIRAADAIITNDSGALHLAKLVRTPAIGLFGPTSPLERVSQPESHSHGDSPPAVTVLWGGAHLSCRPCYDGVHYFACARNECLRSISPEVVIRALESALGAPGSVNPRDARGAPSR